jgi:hypothetical protein
MNSFYLFTRMGHLIALVNILGLIWKLMNVIVNFYSDNLMIRRLHYITSIIMN